jgi:2-phospho-L-lactate guanylyltransferase
LSGWTAIVPFKPPGARKTRLAEILSPAQREILSERLFRHVLGTLRAVPLVSRVVVLSAVRPGDGVAWLADSGGGLNVELHAARRGLGAERVVIVHADLPFFGVADVTALLVAAEAGCAIAPDRHRAGTNALALNGHLGFGFAFGVGSFQAHLLAGNGQAVVVETPGLGFDIDTPGDFELAVGRGFDTGGFCL